MGVALESRMANDFYEVDDELMPMVNAKHTRQSFKLVSGYQCELRGKHESASTQLHKIQSLNDVNLYIAIKK